MSEMESAPESNAPDRRITVDPELLAPGQQALIKQRSELMGKLGQAELARQTEAVEAQAPDVPDNPDIIDSVPGVRD